MNKAIFEKDFSKHTITVTRDFNALKHKVWEAWTTSEMLDKWWGPEPWKAVTKSFEFKEGGYWLYAMTGPNGEKQWCKEVYLTIDPEESFTARDEFCDEEGVRNMEFPSSHWNIVFAGKGDMTTVISTTTYESEEDMKKIVDMGVEAGFTMGLDQLEKLLVG